MEISELAHIEFPSEVRSSAMRPFRGASHALTLPAELTRELSTFGEEGGSDLFVNVVAGLCTLLHRYTKHVRHADWVAVVAARGRVEDAFVARVDFRGEPSFRELVSRARATFDEARAEESGFEAVVSKLDPLVAKRHLRVSFALLSSAMDPVRLERWAARFDLSFCCEQRDGRLVGMIVYNSTVFGAEAIPRLVTHLLTLLQDGVRRPDAHVGMLEVLSAEERAVATFASSFEVPAPKGWAHELIEREAARRPAAPAVVFRDARLSFDALNTRANQIAHHLQSLGVGPDVAVGICLPRSIDLVPAILGTLKAGGAYVPLDPDFPEARITGAARAAKLSVLVTDSRCPDALTKTAKHVVVLDRDGAAIATKSTANPKSGVDAQNRAFIIFTSGSTGEPKGVVISHGSLSHYVTAIVSRLEFTEDDVSMMTASMSFAASGRQFIAPLCCGASVVVPAPDQLRDPVLLMETVQRHGVTLLPLVPSHLRAITTTLTQLEPTKRSQLLANKLRMVMTASEALTADVAANWLALGHSSTLMNMYGLTETTGVFSFYPVNRGEGPTVGVGRPTTFARVRLVDDKMQLVPPGIPGELFLGGPLIATGYWEDEKQTNERFVECTIDGVTERLFRTGDRARIRADRNLELLGRIDDEVKIRGSKVIPDEVRSVLVQAPDIEEAFVIARDSPSGARHLLAYVVPKNGRTLRSGDLRTFMRTRVPDYMVPSIFVKLDGLPRLPNGKVDRRALPEVNLAAPLPEAGYVAPATEEEQALAELWGSVLNVDRVGVADNFFELGGDSLKAMDLLFQMRAALGLSVSMTDLFEHPTVAKLGEVILALRASET